MRTPWPLCGSHQCCTSPSGNWRAAARRICSRSSVRPRESQRHRVLQLVAEAVGAARLVEAGARPGAAGQRLVEQPAIHHDVEGAIGRLDLHVAGELVPVRAHLRKDAYRDRRLRYAATSARAASLSAASPNRKTTSLVVAGSSSKPRAQRRAGIERRRRCGLPGTRPTPAPPARRACRAGRGTRGGRRCIRFARRAGRRTRRLETAGSTDCARTARRVVVELGEDVRRAGGARRAQHPLDVRRDREAALPRRIVAYRAAGRS